MAIRMPAPGDASRDVKFNRMEAELRRARIRIRDLEEALSRSQARLSGKDVAALASSTLSPTATDLFLVDAAITIAADDFEQAKAWAYQWASETRPTVHAVHICQVEEMPDYPAVA